MVSWREEHVARVKALEEAASTMLLAALGDILAPISRNLGSRETLTAAVNPAEARVSLDDLAAISPRWGMAVDEVVLPWFGGVFEAGGAAAQAQLAGIGVVVPAPDPELMNYAARNYLADARPRFTRLGDQAWNNARSELVAGFQAGEGIGALRARVRRAEDLTRSEADRMARTEVISASNAGAVADVELLGDDAPPYRQWLSTLDTRTRPTHVRADGQVIKAGDTFQVGTARLRFPGDPTGPAHEVVQCRCTILFLDDPTPIEPEGRQQGGITTETAEGAQGDIGGAVDVVEETATVTPTKIPTPNPQALAAVVPPGPAVPPDGRKVGDSLGSDGRVPTWAADSRQHVADVIDSVHGDGVLSDIPIRQVPAGDRAGGYFAPGRQQALEIALNPEWAGPEAEFALTHEVGHWLDLEAIGPQSRVAGEAVDLMFGTIIPDRPMNAVMRAIRGSRAARLIDETRTAARDAAGNVASTVAGRRLTAMADYGDYLASPEELWARAYSQWITERSGDDRLRQGMAKFHDSSAPGLPTQWDPEDFAPIAEAIDQLMVTYGWRTP